MRIAGYWDGSSSKNDIKLFVAFRCGCALLMSGGFHPKTSILSLAITVELLLVGRPSTNTLDHLDSESRSDEVVESGGSG
jgi:hypothetical protein